jgi:hypothetical protein
VPQSARAGGGRQRGAENSVIAGRQPGFWRHEGRAPEAAGEDGNFGLYRPQSITKRRFFPVYQKLRADITMMDARWNTIIKLFIS